MGRFIIEKNLVKAIEVILLSAMILSLSTAVAGITTSDTTANKTTMSSDLLLDEGFEDGIMPPTGWELQSAEPDVTWEITTEEVYSGVYAAKCPAADPPYDQNEWLISPEIDLTNAEDIALEFWANCLTYAADWTLYLKLRIVGQDWITLWDCVAEEEWYDGLWHNKTFDLNAYTGEVIQLAWVSDGVDSRVFYLDHIQVYAGEIPPPAELEFSVNKFGIMKISAEITNIATDPDAVAENVAWTISAVGNGVLKKLNFTAEGIIPEIQPGDSAPIELGVSGLSLLEVNVTAVADDPRVNEINEEFRAFVFLIFVFVLS